METVKMFGPALSGPARLVNRDVPACDELAYRAAGYKRGSIQEVEVAEVPEPEVKNPSLGSEELSMEPDSAPSVETEPPAEKPVKARKKKGQN